MKKISKNVQTVLIIGTIIKILGLIYKIISTRILGIEGMRLMTLIMPTLSLALCLSTLSIPTVVNQNIASNISFKSTRTATILKSALRITLVSSSIISLILLFSFPIYKYIYQNTFIYYPLLICIPLIFVSNSTGILRGYLEANNNFQSTYYANFYEQIAKILLTFTLLFIFKNETIEFQVLLAFISMMLSEFASFFYLAIKIKRKNKINYTSVKTNGYEKNILKQALPLTLEQLAITLTNYLEPFIFYYAASKNNISFLESTTYYTQITSFAIPLLIFAFFGVQSIAKFTFPKITTNINNKNELDTTISKAIFLCFLIATFNFMLCYFYAEESLYLLFNDTSSKNIVKQLAPLYFFMYFNPLFVVILQSYKKEKRLLAATIFTSSITLIFIFSFTYFLGIKGLTLGIGFASFIRFIILSIIANKEVNFNLNINKIIIQIILFIIYFFLNKLIHNIIYFLILSLIFYTLELLLFYHFYKNNKNQSYHMKHIKSY